MIKNQYEITENDLIYEVTEYENGTIVKSLKSQETIPIDPPTPLPTMEDKINYIYYKNMGVIA